MLTRRLLTGIANSSLKKGRHRTVPKGCLFIPLLGGNETVENHPLDTDLDKYYMTMETTLLPACMEIARDAPHYTSHIKEVLTYNVPSFRNCWNFGVELTYRKLTPEDQQTEENLTLMRILRWCMDITFSMSSILDDISDSSPTRRHKPSWHSVCPGGASVALYDGSVLGYLPFYLMKKYLSHHPNYSLFLETMAKANYNMLIGQTMDTMDFSKRDLSKDNYSNTATYKAGHFVEVQPTLGMLLAGCSDRNLLSSMEEIFNCLGRTIQIFDDFCDYYCKPEQTGKPSSDQYNGANTWVSSTAIDKFDAQQKAIFMDCYGSSDPAKKAKVHQLYDTIDIPGLYLEQMRKTYKTVKAMVLTLPDIKLQEIAFSYTDWLIGGIADETK